MKARTLVMTMVLLIALFPVLSTVQGMIGGPPSDENMGPGMNGNDPKGPRWEQQTENRQVEKGLMFRYGIETPETTIESENTGDDIGMRLSQLRFENQTSELSVNIDEEEWEVAETEDGGIKVNYRSRVTWISGDEPTEHRSDMTINYLYKSNGNRSIDYQVTISDPPGEGNITVRMDIESREQVDGCCWQKRTMSQNQGSNSLSLITKNGEELSQFMVNENGIVETDDGDIEVDAAISEEIMNSTAAIDVGMELPTGSNSASISGSLYILDGLMEAFLEGAEEVAKFVMDHIYYFAGGALITIILIIAVVSGLSRRNVATGGNDLDLGNNRYYKGDQ